jgi:hypothetical protein
MHGGPTVTRLDDIKARVAAATDGPWVESGRDVICSPAEAEAAAARGDFRTAFAGPVVHVFRCRCGATRKEKA